MRMRPLLLALALLPLPSLAQDVEQSVTLSAKATSVKSILSMLEKATSVPFVVNPQLAEQRLIVSVKGRSLKETMDRIAESAGGSWIPERGGFRLVRTQAMQQQLAAQALRDRTARIKKSLDEQRAASEKNTIKTPAQAKARAEAMAKMRQEMMEEMSRQTGSFRMSIPRTDAPQSPASDALASLASLIGADMLARIPTGGRAVFALTPTRSQFQLPSATAARVAREFDAANALYTEAMQAIPQDATPGRPMLFDSNNPEAVRKGPTTEIVVQVQSHSFHHLSFVVWFVNKDGEVISESSTGISLDPPATPTPSGLPDSTKPITFSEDAITHAKLLANSPTGSGRGLRVISRGGETMIAVTAGPGSPATPRPDVSARWKEILSKPSQYEPLAFAASEAVLQAAEQLGDNVVANLPDDAVMTFARTGGEPLSMQRFWSALSANLKVLAERKNGWLVLKSSDPLRSEATRLNRAAAQTFYAPLVAGDQPSLDPLAAFVASTTLGAIPSTVGETLGLINPATRGVYEAAMRDQAAYHLYASFGPQDRERLARGASVPLQNLNPAQQGLVRHLLFDSPMGPQSRLPRPAGMQESRTVSMRSGGGGGVTFGGMGRLSDERTEFMPNGFPLQAEFSLKMEREEAVEASSSTSDDMQMMTAQELALIRRMGRPREDGGPSIGITPPNYDRFRLGSMTRFVLTVQQRDTFELTRLLDDPKVSGRILGYDELPQDFRKRVESSGPPAPGISK